MRDDRQRILDILEAIQRIERHTSQGRQAFNQNELVQTWVIHHLQIIGEASRSLSDETSVRYPKVPWTKIVGMRHILVHQYFGVDTEVGWNVTETHLPQNKAALSTAVHDQ